MDIVARWTGRHGLALAEAMRLPREVFARKLGISPRTMADWAKQPSVPLALKTQELLDVVLEQSADVIRMRFVELLQPAYWPELIGAALPDPAADLVASAAAYQTDAAQAVELLSQLSAADLSDRLDIQRPGWIKAAGPGAVTAYLFDGATLAESSPGDDIESVEPANRIRSVAHHLMDLDFQLGGGVVRRMLLVYFQQEVTPLLRGSHPDHVRRDILRAVAEVCQLLGWSAYDAGAHAAAQGYYTQGLRLAREASDKRLAGYLLGDLSHQANFLGEYGDAFQLACASESIANGSATATQTSAALAMAARASASRGERTLCLDLIGRMEATFERRKPGKDPYWISYFTPEEMAGEALHCYADLGMTDKARESAALAIGPKTPPRTRVFIDLTAARAIARGGELDEAIDRAKGALVDADVVASLRCKRYVVDFTDLLKEDYGRDQRVEQFLAYIKENHPNLLRPRQLLRPEIVAALASWAGRGRFGAC